MEDTLSQWYFARDGLSLCPNRIYTLADGPEWLTLSGDVLKITSNDFSTEPSTEMATVTVALEADESITLQFQVQVSLVCADGFSCGGDASSDSYDPETLPETGPECHQMIEGALMENAYEIT